MSARDKDLPFVEKGEEPRDFDGSTLLKFPGERHKIFFSAQGAQGP
jgi:hypothetical protein